MSLHADVEDFPLTLALDLRHPFAYLALGPTRALAQRLGIALNCLPFAAQPLNAPSEPGPDDDRGVLHRRHRAHAIAREIAVYADAQGLVVREPYRSPDPTLAHAAWLWVRDSRLSELDAFLDALFAGYWSVALDLEDLDAMSALVADADAAPDDFQKWWSTGEGRAALEAGEDALRAAGVSQVPASLVEDEVFFGRQHLPMIEWILDGRSGPVPI